MTKSLKVLLEPRKTPLQARSTASVEAILQATIQVLLKDGLSKLTTTRIAKRAGVSVGTLYQYFPNKKALLQALLKDHLDQVSVAMEKACVSVHGATLNAMATTTIAAFVAAKFKNIDASAALYAVSDSIEGKRIASEMHRRATCAMAEMLATAKGGAPAEPELVAATLLRAMAGVARGMLESGVNRATMATMERELCVMARGYLTTSARSVKA